MLIITYKSGETKKVSEPFKIKKEELENISSIKKVNEYRKYIENALQSFVHSVNMLSRSGVECPFSNLSFFDRPKLRAMLSDDNMGWYFDKNDVEEDYPAEAIKDCGDGDWIDYIIETIIDLQDIYCDVMDKGDTLHNNRMITFPVSTANISRIEKDGKYEVADPKFVEDFCNKHDVVRYNIYISDGMKVASCCVCFNTPFQYKDQEGNVHAMNFGDYVETRLKDSNLGNKEYIFERLDGTEFIKAPHNRWIPITAVIKKKNSWGRLIKVTFTTGDEIWVTPDHEFLLKNEEFISAKDLISGSLLYKELEVKEVDSYESDDPVYTIEVDSEDHIYSIKLPSGYRVSSSNCRLINDVELFKLGGQVNSFGGTALSLGSHRVVTINLRRCSLESNGDWDKFLEIVKTRMEEAADILYAHKALLRDLTAKGVQPFISNGWIDLDRTFSTFGIMGYYEAAEDFKKIDPNRDFIKELIELINEEAFRITKEKGNVYNVEQIPGETQARKLLLTDQWLFNR